MKNNSFTSIIHRLFAVSAALILLMAQSTGCSKEDSEEHGILDISDVVLLDQIYTSIGSEVSISDRKSTRLNSSHKTESRMPSSA